MKNRTITSISPFLFLTVVLFFYSCGTPGYEPGEEDPPGGEIPQTEPVIPDGILETVTWNIEWYGANDNFRQTKNAVRVMDSLDADLFALQEIHSREALATLLEPLTGYHGFTAGHVSKGQKMAFVYNTHTIDSLEAGAITDVREEYQQKWEHSWANGRTPLYFRFNYTFKETTIEYYAVVVHGKANTADHGESYKRRQRAAEGLFYYLMDEKPNANIILLGDYNDDVDESLYYHEPGNFSETPYDEFVEHPRHFDVITHALSLKKESSSLNYMEEGNLIDHITVSDELFPFYMDESAAVYDAPLKYITNFESTTSDHLPVWAKFDMTR